MTTRTKTKPSLLRHLHRGGAYGCWFTIPGEKHHWFKAGEPTPVPTGAVSVYFCVHPMSRRKRSNKTVAAINCLYGDFDAKDYEDSKPAILAHLDTLPLSPSVIIDSGGGYHCYWLLDEPFMLTTDDDRDQAAKLQRAWVTFVGSDQGTLDLARVLRVPGTVNYKTEYKPDYPTVTVIKDDPGLTYSLTELKALLPPLEPTPTPKRRTTPAGEIDVLRKERYWQQALESAAEMIRQSGGGGEKKHPVLLKASKLLGGYVAGGLGNEPDAIRLLEAEIRRKPDVKDLEAADQTIQDGLAYGAANPITYADKEQERRDWLAGQSGRTPRAVTEQQATSRTISDDNGQEPDPDTKRLPHKLGSKLPRELAELVSSIAPEPPDPALVADIDMALQKRTEDDKRIWPAFLRRRLAGDLMLAWLAQHGGFVQSETEQLFYFYKTGRKLFSLTTAKWAAWLHSLTGVNPASTEFAHLMADCKGAAIFAPKRKVVRLAAWDDADQVLRVSRFDGTVYALDGENITEEPNGERVLFHDGTGWEPYTPNFTTPGALEWLSVLPNWAGAEEIAKLIESGDDQTELVKLTRLTTAYSLAFRTWALTTFFTELCPSRPHAVFLGEKGSGKSMALRTMLKLMFGANAELSGIPDKPDGFTSAAAASHILVLDNLDQFTGWLRDKLARLATGARDHYRKLYTGNEEGQIDYRCWVGITARTPDTLRRDDLADRLLLLPVEILNNMTRRNETEMINQAAARRGDFWGDVLTRLNKAVAALRRGELSSKSRLRMADWEVLGRLLADCEGNEPLWDDLVTEIARSQSGFLLEGDLLVEALDLWMKNKLNYGREVSTRDLYQEWTTLLFGEKKTPKDWPKSVLSLGKRLAGIRRELRQYYAVEWRTASGRKLLYSFTPVKEK